MLPYVAWVMAIVAVVAIGAYHPVSVSRKTFYCIVDRTDLTVVLGVYSMICCISTCVLEGRPFITIDFRVSDNVPQCSSLSTFAVTGTM